MGVTNLDSLTLGGNLVVGGTQTVTGNITYAGDVTLGDAYTDAVTINGQATMTVAANGAAGYELTLQQDSASPTTGDAVGLVKFVGQDDAANAQEYAQVSGVILDSANGSEAGQLSVSVANASGTVTKAMTVEHDGSGAIVSVGDGSNEGILASSGDQDLVLETGNATTGSISITDGADGKIALSPNGDGVVELGGATVYSDITSTSGAGAVPITGSVHEITTTGAGDALTLANGVTDGQRLTVLYVAEGAGGDTAVLTPTTLAGGTQITFTNLGDTAELTYSSTGGWYMHGGSAVIS